MGEIAVTVDGADEVDEHLNLIKGGGGALTREKIVNDSTRRNIIIVDESKVKKRLGETWAVPVEVLRFGFGHTRDALGKLGPVRLRAREGSAFVTDAGNFIIDVTTGPIADSRGARSPKIHDIPASSKRASSSRAPPWSSSPAPTESAASRRRSEKRIAKTQYASFGDDTRVTRRRSPTLAWRLCVFASWRSLSHFWEGDR